MNVTLNITNDAELRAYVKECIKGQVLSIVRDEFMLMVIEELQRKIKGTSLPNFEAMTKTALREAVTHVLYKEHKVGEWNNEFIKPFVEQQVNKAIAGKDWKAMVDALAKEKVRSLIG